MIALLRFACPFVVRTTSHMAAVSVHCQDGRPGCGEVLSLHPGVDPGEVVYRAIILAKYAGLVRSDSTRTN